jgi:hypothetical protein
MTDSPTSLKDLLARAQAAVAAKQALAKLKSKPPEQTVAELVAKMSASAEHVEALVLFRIQTTCSCGHCEVATGGIYVRRRNRQTGVTSYRRLDRSHDFDRPWKVPHLTEIIHESVPQCIECWPIYSTIVDFELHDSPFQEELFP